MWVRKRLDISVADIVWGLSAMVRFSNIQHSDWQVKVTKTWLSSTSGSALACLSVRSGFDLLLQALQLPPGSQVAMTALTIPDMVKIVRHHGLIPVPIDLDTATMAPQWKSLKKAITPQTKLMVIAHLFGGRIDLEPILKIAKQSGILVVEDCAQAFYPGFTGHSEADVSCFSFGTIKTATALGGGLLRIKDQNLYQKMQKIQSTYPIQSRWQYGKKLGKYLALMALSNRLIFRSLIQFCRWAKIDYNQLLNQAVKGFAGGNLIQRLREQPCVPLIALLHYRLSHYDTQEMEKRSQPGQILTQQLQQLAPQIILPGIAADPHHHWVVPILTENPVACISRLAKAGFDATQGSSMAVVEPPDFMTQHIPEQTLKIFQRLVYLPCYPAISSDSLTHLAQLISLESPSPQNSPSFQI